MIISADPGNSQDGGFLIKSAEEPLVEDHFQKTLFTTPSVKDCDV